MRQAERLKPPTEYAYCSVDDAVGADPDVCLRGSRAPHQCRETAKRLGECFQESLCVLRACPTRGEREEWFVFCVEVKESEALVTAATNVGK